MKLVNYFLVAAIGVNVLAGGTIYLPVKLGTTQEQVKATSSKDQVISKDEALKIALDAAGANKENVTDLEVKLEDESNRLSSRRHPYVYEVEFKYNGFEYEYEIDAITKQVLRSETDRID